MNSLRGDNYNFKGSVIGRPYFIVIDPGVRTPELDTFNLISSLAPYPCSYQMPALFGFNSMPQDLEHIRGVIVLGSLASVHDGSPWQPILERWIATAIVQNIPILGCCFGFQLLAHMFGGKVSFMHEDKRKYQGARTVEILRNPLWDVGSKRLIVSHAEHVHEMPREFSLIARSQDVRIEGFAHENKPIFGLQAHPEATKLFLMDRQIDTDSTFEALADGHNLLRAFVNMAR